MTATPPPDPTIEIVVAAFDAGIDRVLTELAPSLPGERLLVVHQVTDDRFEADRDLPPNVRYLVRRERGLSRNRNVGLEHAEADVVVIADDDSTYLPGAFDRIRAAYRRNPSAAAITFRTDTDARWPAEFEHGPITVGQVYSLLITFRPAWLRSHGIVFDERFGLGAIYEQGEENILLADIRRAGGLVMGCPERIIPAPGPTSGDVFTPERITAKVRVARRMNGWPAGLLTAMRFGWTKRDLYRAHGTTAAAYARAAVRGLTWGWSEADG